MSDQVSPRWPPRPSEVNLYLPVVRAKQVLCFLLEFLWKSVQGRRKEKYYFLLCDFLCQVKSQITIPRGGSSVWVPKYRAKEDVRAEQAVLSVTVPSVTSMKGLRLALWTLTLPSAGLNAADLSQPFCLRGEVSDLAWSLHCDLLSLGPWMWLPDGSSPSFLHQALHSWLLVWLWFFSTAFSGQTMTVLTSSVCFFFIANHWISLYPGILEKTRHTDYKVQITTLNWEAAPVLLFSMSGVGSCYGLEVFMPKYSYTDWQLDPQCGDFFKKWDQMSG